MVDDGAVHKMVMSIGWNPVYKNEKRSMVCMYVELHELNYRAWHCKSYHVTKTGSHFIGQKRNEIILF